MHHQGCPSIAAPGSNMALRACASGLGLRHVAAHAKLQQPWARSRSFDASGTPAAATASVVAAAAVAARTRSNSSNTTSRSGIRCSSSSSDTTTSTRRQQGEAAAAAAGQVADSGSAGSSGKTLMIVESPTKASKIQKFLGSDYKVVASYGHVRDLANKTGSVKPQEGFGLVWAVSRSGDARLSDMAAASAGCGALLLATDPDREGEAIAWHITEELQRRGVLPRPGLSLSRVTFTEVTAKAVKEALAQPRQVSSPLVDAYLARRALDYLVGFNLSPLLWRRLGPAARSAGRVQSVALRLVAEREDAVQLFTPEEYWTIAADFAPAGSSSSSSSSSSSGTGSSSSAAAVLNARLAQVDGQRLQQMSLQNQEDADALVRRLWQQQQQQQQQDRQQQQQDRQQQHDVVYYRVRSVVKQPVKRHPPPPLVTSTLQQEAARRLGFSASKTMQVAQQLYEGANTGEGFITYMRTDGVNLSAEAVDGLRGVIAAAYGADYMPAGGPRVYKSRAKNAQEAHEAIRPTDPSRHPDSVVGQLSPDQAKLYSLVWRRAVASQMESAEMQQVTVELLSPCGSLMLRSSGSSLTFPGYLAAWDGLGGVSNINNNANNTQDDGPEASLSEPEDDLMLAAGAAAAAAAGGGGGGGLSELLQMHEGQEVQLMQVLPAQHFTKPPPRYTEASMVKALEEAGVGRPSTYAPILRLLQERGYVVKSGRALKPTPLGRLLTAYLTIHFREYVDVNFTARVEEQLDEVSAGSLPWKQLLSDFYSPLDEAVAAAAKVSTTEVFNQLDHKLEHLIFTQTPPPAAAAADDDDDNTDPTAAAAESDSGAAAAAAAALDPRTCPVCGGRLVLKPSRIAGGFVGCSNHDSLGCSFGRPLWPDDVEQLALSDEEEELAAAAGGGSLHGGAAAAGGTVIGSSKLLGTDPATGLHVWIKRGPYGLYVQLGDDAPNPAAAAAADTSSSSSSSSKAKRSKAPGPPRSTVPRGVSWSSVTLEAALALLALPKTLGVHPSDGEPILANNGRFGPYVRHRSLFVTLPKDCSLEQVTLEDALQLIEAKVERCRAKGRDPYAVKARPGKKGSSSSSSKGMSGYNLFFREMKGQVAAAADTSGSDGSSSSGGGGSGSGSGSSSSSSGRGSVLSQLAAAWRELSEEARSTYNERAKQINAAASQAAERDAASSSSSGGDGTSSKGQGSSTSTRRSRSSTPSSSSSRSRGRSSAADSSNGSRREYSTNSSSTNSSSGSSSGSNEAGSSSGGSRGPGTAGATSNGSNGRSRRRAATASSTAASGSSSSSRSRSEGAAASSNGVTSSRSSSSSSRRRPTSSQPPSGYMLFVSSSGVRLLPKTLGPSPARFLRCWESRGRV